jgi:hypothetical protein
MCVACAVAAAGSAAADEGDHEKALQAFRAARADIAAGNCAAAIPKLEESLAYEPSVGAHLSMADCYEQVDLVAAWRKLQEAAELAAAKSDAREGIARERAAALEPRLPMLRFSFTPADADLSGLGVRVDGRLEPLLPVRRSIPTTPGAHDVEITLPHKKPWRGRVVARSAGTVVDVDVSIVDEDAAAPAPIPSLQPASPTSVEETPRGHVQHTAALWSGGAGLVGIVVGSVSGIIALSDNAKLRDACGGNVHQCVLVGSSDVPELQSSARTAAAVSTVAFIVGGVGLGAGILLYATEPSPRRVEIRTTAVPGAAGISLGGPFD